MEANTDIVTIPREEYDLLIKAEMKINFLREIHMREGYISTSILKYFLGIPEEESKDESSK